MRLHWTPALATTARAAVASARGDLYAAARALSREWGASVTYDSLSSALRRWPEAGENRNANAANPAESPAFVNENRNAPVAPAPTGPAVEAERRTGAATPAAPAPVPSNGLVAILADMHIPQHDPAALACVESWLAANQPAIVVLAGDVGEWESCSQHGTSPEAPSFKADVEAVRSWLRKLRGIVPNARIIYMEGNHETRLSRMVCALAPNLYGAVSVRESLGLDALGIEWVPEDRQPIELGTLYIVHGHQMLRGNGPVYIAAKAVNVYGSPGHTVVVAHTHKRQMFRRPMAAGHAEGIAVPCLRTLGAGWLHGEVAGWSLGFTVATMREGRRTAVEVIDIDDGSCVWGGRVYGAA